MQRPMSAPHPCLVGFRRERSVSPHRGLSGFLARSRKGYHDSLNLHKLHAWALLQRLQTLKQSKTDDVFCFKPSSFIDIHTVRSSKEQGGRPPSPGTSEFWRQTVLS